MAQVKKCPVCGKKVTRAPQSIYCSRACFWIKEYERRKNKPNRVQRGREYREDWKDRGLCSSCASPKEDLNKATCYTCLQRSKDRDLSLKKEVFEHYGGLVCACIGCGIHNINVLELDHINGGGNAERKTVGSGKTFYKYLKKNKYPAGYRVLCANCNKGRWVHGGECPLHAQ